MSLPLRTVTGIISAAGCAALLLAVALLPGGCPAGGSTTPDGSGTDVAGASTDDQNTTDDGTGGDTTGGNGGDTSNDTTTGGDNNGDATTDGTGDANGDATDAGSGDGFTTGAIILRAAGGFPADPKFGIPAPEYFNTDGSIQTSVQIPHVSKDGTRIWFATQDGNGFVEPQLFCMNTNGSGLQEIALPADLPRMPVELWPSADGQVCALIINTGVGTDFSQSTVRLADRRTGLITMLLDGQLIPEGKDDFDNIQITDDGGTVFFKDVQQNLICSIPAGGGSRSAVSTLADYAKTDCAARAITSFRINGDASAFVANVWFYGPDHTYPSDMYLKTNAGVTALTATGDAPQGGTTLEYMGVSDDSRYVVYQRFISSASSYRAYVLDRNSGVTTQLPTGSARDVTLLDSAGTVVFTSWAIDHVYSGVDQLPGLGTLDASSALEVIDGWAGIGAMTSMSAYGNVLVGTWANGAFGDPSRLYAWFANSESYRDGPSITGVGYKFDTTAGTLTIRATVAGPVTEVDMLALYQNFDSFYQLADDHNPFYNERWGAEMPATDQTGVYEYTASLRGLTLDGDYRIRITAADNDAKNFAYVDFRPVPVGGESVDRNGDGIAD